MSIKASPLLNLTINDQYSLAQEQYSTALRSLRTAQSAGAVPLGSMTVFVEAFSRCGTVAAQLDLCAEMLFKLDLLALKERYHGLLNVDAAQAETERTKAMTLIANWFYGGPNA